MMDSAAHLVDEVLPKRPIRQWVLSVPYPLRYLFATNPKVMSQVLTIVHRVISTFLIKRARMTVKSGAQSGAVTLIQRFGSALNLNPHFHMLYLNGVIEETGLAAAVLNHPANGICWVAKRFAPHGVALEPGQIILSGSFTAPIAVKPGDTIHADYGRLGSLSCQFV